MSYISSSDVPDALQIATTGNCDGFLASVLSRDSIFSGTPEAIRGVNWAAPQSVSSYGNGFDAFAALDPTLSGLIPGGMDETPQAWISTDYKSKNPWSAIFGTGADEDDRGKQNLKAAQGFLKTVLGL